MVRHLSKDDRAEALVLFATSFPTELPVETQAATIRNTTPSRDFHIQRQLLFLVLGFSFKQNTPLSKICHSNEVSGDLAAVPNIGLSLAARQSYQNRRYLQMIDRH